VWCVTSLVLLRQDAIRFGAHGTGASFPTECQSTMRALGGAGRVRALRAMRTD